jgi:predicted outer membrane repeat protein
MGHRLIWLVAALGTTASARVWQVPDDYARIGEAIDVAEDGDRIEIAPGTYFETGLNCQGKAITLTGLDPLDPTTVQSTVVDGSESGRILELINGEGAETRIEGLTFAHGRAMGAAIYCESTSPTIRNCLLLDNAAKGQSWNYAGGIYCRGGAPQVEGCWFLRNRADWGGGLRIAEGSTARISGCVFSGNQVLFDGAGIDVFEAEPTVEDCLFADNHAGYGGAIYWAKSPQGRISRSQFRGNTANWGGGVYLSVSSPEISNSLFVDNDANWGGALHAFSSSPTIRYCTISGNSARDAGGAIYVWGNGSQVSVTGSILWGDAPREIRARLGNHVFCTYSDIQGGRAGEGNIETDPQFTEYAGISHLLAPASPAIDSGPAGETDAIIWPGFYPNSLLADMGVYGGPGAELPGGAAISQQALAVPGSIP